MTPKLPRRSRLRHRLLLAAGAGVLALIIAEAGLRIMGPLGPEFVLDSTTSLIDPALYTEDDELLTTLAPNANAIARTVAGERTIRINSLGMRGGPVTAKGPDELRLLVVGDSFTLGTQVDEPATVSEQLGGLLTEKAGRPIVVFNGGVSGYGTDQATIRMKRLVPAAQIDAVLLLFYTGNDLRDNALFSTRVTAHHNPPPVPPMHIAPPRDRNQLRQLAGWSRIAAYLQVFLAVRDRQADPRIGEYHDELWPFADRRRLDALIPATKFALARFGQACTQLDVRCAVGLVPPAYAVHTARLNRTFTAFGMDPDEADLDAPAVAIAEAAPENVVLFDLAAPLRAHADTPLYLTFDPHWSDTGHRTAAEALADELLALLRRGPASRGPEHATP